MSIAIKEVKPTDYTVIEVLSTETVPVEILSTEPINPVGENTGKVLIVEGEKGDPFTFEDFTPEQLEQLKGEKGDPFVYSDFTEEQLANLKGEAGYTPQKGIDYFDGYTPQKGIDYFDGYTPIKGVDYFDGKDGKDGTVSFNDLTDEQKESLKGKDGYTPIKGVDYFDGEDGYTPIKGVDYFDGKDGTDGKDGADGKDGLTTSVNGVQQVNGNITLTPDDIGALSKQGGTVTGNITIERTNYPGFALKNNTAGSMMTVSAADDGVAIFQNEKGTDYTTLYVRPPSEGIDNALQLGHSQNGAWVGAVVLHNKNFASHISAGAIGAEAAGSVNAHNADANAHSTLFAGKANSPTAVTVDSYANFTVADNCEYRLTDLSTLIMAGSTGKAHGFVDFSLDVQTVSVSVTGFSGTGGDDVAEAVGGEVWEFSCDNGYILWKNWSA